MSEVDFQKLLTDLAKCDEDIARLKAEVERTLGPEPKSKVLPVIDSMVGTIDTLKSDLQQIQAVYAVRNEIQAQVLLPVVKEINKQTAVAVETIKTESNSGIWATQKWAIIGICLALVVGWGFDRVKDGVVDWAYRQTAPIIKFQNGMEILEPRAFFETNISSSGVKSFVYLHQIRGDFQKLDELPMAVGSRPVEVLKLDCDLEGSNFRVKEVLFCPEDEFLYVTGEPGWIPQVTYHPHSPNEKNMAFVAPESGLDILGLKKNLQRPFFLELLNWKNKATIKFRLIAKIYVESFHLGLPGRLWGGREFTYFKDFELRRAPGCQASGTYELF